MKLFHFESTVVNQLKEFFMKKIITAFAIGVLGVAAAFSANAQQAKIGGLSVAANINLVGASFDSSTSSNYQEKQNSAIGQSISAQLSYGFQVGQNAVISVGATAAFGDIKAGYLKPYDFKVSNASSFYIEPGYSSDGSTTLYLKISQNSMTASYSGDPTLGAIDGSTSFSGMGLGAGIRKMVDSQKFVQVEINQVNYKESSIKDGTSYKPMSTALTVGIGYRF
jgi:Outer membrane protein beta-barrel domain